MEARTTTTTKSRADKLTLSTAQPPASSPSIALRPATAVERAQHSLLSAPSWKGPLPTAEAFVQREDVLHRTELCRDGGITGWVLIDNGERGRGVLMGGESIRKRGLVCRAGGEVEEVLVHSVGAVYCPEENRGRGYARRFMDHLAQRLEGWQIDDKKVVSVLYSEIGGDFYARHGWHAHPSRHIRLGVRNGPILHHDHEISWPKDTHPVFPQDVAALAARDEALLRQTLVRKANTTSHDAFALIPDVQTFEWFRAREMFVCNELLGSRAAPTITGAVVRDPGSGRALAWCVWTCMWFEPDVTSRGRNTLYILRMVVDGDGGTVDRESAVASLFGAARSYAGRWGMDGVEAWNPDETMSRAAERAMGGPVEVVERRVESIACLNMYGDGKEVEWVANEKFGWC